MNGFRPHSIRPHTVIALLQTARELVIALELYSPRIVYAHIAENKVLIEDTD